MALSKTMLIGNLGADPELRYTQGGAAVVQFTVATTETWKDKTSQEQKERTEWHRVVVFDRLAENVAKYLHKGSKVYVEGANATRKYQAKDGSDRYVTEIKARVVDFLDPKGSTPERSAEPAQPLSQPEKKGDFEPFAEDDIPF